MIRGALLIALASLLWATTGIVAKFLFSDTDLQPLTLGLLRLLVALPFFWVLMKRELDSQTRAGEPRRLWPSVTRPALLVLSALGPFQAFYPGSYLLAVDLTGAGLATLISLYLPPVLVAILAVPIPGENPRLVPVLALTPDHPDPRAGAGTAPATAAPPPRGRSRAAVIFVSSGSSSFVSP